MKVAVTCENGTVFQHFGHTPEFAIYDVEDGRILAESVKSCGDSGHGALAGLLAEVKVSGLFCGGIGGGAINALKEIDWFRLSVRDIRGYRVEEWSDFTDIVKKG